MKKRDRYGSLPSTKDREELEGLAEHIGRLVGALVDPAGIHFFLIVSQEDPTWATWVANADRESSVQLLRETASRLEHRSDVPPGVRPDDEPNLVRFTTQKVSETPVHTRLSIFANGAKCGELTLRTDEASALVDLLYREQPIQ